MFYQTTTLDGETIFRVDTEKDLVLAPSGMFTVNSDSLSVYLEPLDEKFLGQADVFVPEASHVVRDVDRMLRGFADLSNRARLARSGFVNKTSVLMYGPPGTGKTSLAAYLIQQYVKEFKAIGIYNPFIPALEEIIEAVRVSEPDRLIFCLLDEVDSVIKSYSEAMLAKFLDGVDISLNNVAILATTNRLGAFNERLVNRPSRFAALVEVGFTTLQCRVAFILSKFPGIDPAVAESLALLTDGLSTDYTKDAALQHLVYGMSVEEIENAHRERTRALIAAGVEITRR